MLIARYSGLPKRPDKQAILIRFFGLHWFHGSHWPSLEELNRFLAPMRRVPNGFWIVIAVTLFLLVSALAKARQRREQAALSEEYRWQVSPRWSPIEDVDWQQLSKNSGLGTLSLAGTRNNFTWGTHRGVAFVLFEVPGRMVRPEVRAPDNMIAFHRPAESSLARSLTLGEESAAWQTFLTDHWIFLRIKTPHWVVGGERAARFVEEAYQQFQIAVTGCNGQN
jgi:hypothetical protein